MWNLIAPALALAGTVIGINANNTAATTATNTIVGGEQQAVGTIQAGQTGAINAILGGMNTAESTLTNFANNEQTQNAAGPTFLRQVVATPDTLTPSQAAALDLQRQSVANQLHGSNFAGSGQTAAALFKQSEADFVNNAIDKNRQNAINAASALNSNANNAATTAASGIANTATQGSNAIANTTSNSSNTIAGLESNAANATAGIQSNAGIANASLTGKAIGDIGSSIAQANKPNITIQAAPNTSSTNLNNVG